MAPTGQMDLHEVLQAGGGEEEEQEGVVAVEAAEAAAAKRRQQKRLRQLRPNPNNVGRGRDDVNNKEPQCQGAVCFQSGVNICTECAHGVNSLSVKVTTPQFLSSQYHRMYCFVPVITSIYIHV